jgi:hypothetical protein
VIKLLLDEGVDPDSKDKYGRTPLSRAAENGYEAVVKLLLDEERVDPDFKNKDVRTPIVVSRTIAGCPSKVLRQECLVNFAARMPPVADLFSRSHELYLSAFQ